MRIKEIVTKSGKKYTIIEDFIGQKTFDECAKQVVDYYINLYAGVNMPDFPG